MKRLVTLSIICWLVLACNDTTNRKSDIDTHSSTSVSKTERARQIDNAKNNRALLPGKWQVMEVRSEDDQTTKLDLKELNFDLLDFSVPGKYTAWHQAKILDNGTYEWMAEDRELVLTSIDETVQRMLLKKMNRQYLKLKFNGNYFTFKKVN